MGDAGDDMFDKIFEENVRLDEEEDQSCKGVYWKGCVSQFYKNGVLGLRTYLKPLKKVSCPGCAKCGWIDEYIREAIEDIDLSNIENGKTYTYDARVSQGYYDLYPEIDSLIFIEVSNL